MKIKVYSRNVDFKLKAAIHSMCGYALARLGISSRITKNLNLTIHMGHHSNEGEARVAKDTNRYRPRDFKIYLDHHRMSWRDSGLLWKGVSHNPKNLLHYYELPYEVEAHGREYGLLVGFLLVWTDLEKKFEKELNNLV